MKTLLIFSALIGFTLPEKLDRTYLPPPGSKFSGGSPGAIDVPLEFPKETYSSSSQNNNYGRPEIAIGIDKIGSNISPEKYRDITSTVPSFQGNFYGFPTTTTSNTFLQTNSYLPAEASTIEPNILINAKYPINNSINITTPGYFREKYLSLDHTGPNKEQMLNDINDILENQLPDNKISSQFVKNLSDETQHSTNGHLNTITKINLYSGNVGIPGITSTPAEFDHSLLSNNYDTTRSPLSSEPISQNEANFISSTPIQSSIISTAQTNKTNTSHSYHSRPEGIQEQDREAVILNYDNTITPDGYAYSFDTSNGIHADEKGTAINGVRAEGSYSYIGDDGQLYRVNYTADENGFRPHGAHLPTAPPIPDAILKVIEQAAADKANGIYDDGSYDDNKYGYKKYNPNIRLLKQYNKNRQGTNLNRNKSDNQLPHNRLGENLNKKNDSDEKNEQNYETKNQIQPYIKTYLVNGSVSEILPIDKSEQFKKNKEKNYINSNARNNVYNNNNIYNKILSSMPHLKDIEKEEKLMSIESYDETGYHYSKPQNEYTLKAADKLLNKFPETPNSIEIPAKYKKIVNNVSPIKTPSITLDDDIFEDHDGDDQSLDIPTKYHEDQNIILSNPTSRPFPILAKTEIVPGKTENRIHDFTIQFKQPDKSSSDDGYLYIKNGNSNNESEVPFLSSTEIGLSDITSTIPRLSKLSDSSLFQNQVPFSNPSLDQGKNPKTLTHSNRLDNYENNDDNDITDSGSTYSTPNMYGGIKDYILEHSTPKTYSEGFSGPEQAQKFDPLTGYYY